MTESTDTDDAEAPNVSKLREMALRGDNYREAIEEFTYYGMEGDLYVRPLPDPVFLPMAAIIENKLDLEVEEAQEMLEDEKEVDEETGERSVDASEFDDEFILVMSEAAVKGIDTTQGIAEGCTDEDLREIFAVERDESGEPVGIGLQGGKTLVIAERILSISSDAEKAESFRRDGGSE